MAKTEQEDLIVDVGSKAEAFIANNGTPLHKIESLCMHCGENGITRLLLTHIPHFCEVVLMAFECPHCNERNNEVQFVHQLQPQGCVHTLKVLARDTKVLNRQVVKSKFATIKVPELEFLHQSQPGTLSTIARVLTRTTNELQTLQEVLKKEDIQTAEEVDTFLTKINACVKGEQDFTFTIDDPSGNSYIENPYAPNSDPLLTTIYYNRTHKQQEAIDFLNQRTSSTINNEKASPISTPNGHVKYDLAGTSTLPHHFVGALGAHHAITYKNSFEISDAIFKYSTLEEVMTFPSTCGACGVKVDTHMFVTNIPYFKEVIVMASSCDACGYKNCELKPGGKISERGKKISLVVKSVRDLSRDVIKSDTTSVKIPELELELLPGILGGLVTTNVEGLLINISENLKRVHGFSIGDSVETWKRSKWQEFDSHLQRLLKVEEEWTLILDDALANSFIAPTTDDFESDTQLNFEEYEGTYKQDEDLGLHDMDTSTANGAYKTN